MLRDQKVYQIYQDSWRIRFHSIPGIARYRVENPAPQLGGVQCPALEYTFSVSTNGGKSWRNPRESEQQELRQSIIDTGGCCRQDLANCPIQRT